MTCTAPSNLDDFEVAVPHGMHECRGSVLVSAHAVRGDRGMGVVTEG